MEYGILLKPKERRIVTHFPNTITAIYLILYCEIKMSLLSCIIKPNFLEHIMKGSFDRNIIPKSVRILDVSWSPDTKINMKEEFKKAHIPEAQHFDLFASSKACRLYRKPFPIANEFESYCKFQIGLNHDDHVVVYDRSPYGFQASSKAFWTFKMLGHENVSVLNGGLFGWINQQGKIQNGDGYSKTNGNWKYNPRREKFWRRNFHQILDTIHHHDDVRKEIVVDTRNRDAFDFQHIKHSINLPYSTLFDKRTGFLKTRKDLISLLENSSMQMEQIDERTINVKGNYVASSLTGMSATSLSLVLYYLTELFKDDIYYGYQMPVYAGSWTEFDVRAYEKYKVRK
ncbi:hypothetical protein SNEBB_011454 [Seison nebaliae]|nr:hypothetical protein SNEBB_011454 [Seison nebaliae]